MSRETFVALLVPNLQAVRRLVQRRLRTSDQTEDIVQQALLRAFVHRGQLSLGGHPKPAIEGHFKTVQR